MNNNPRRSGKPKPRARRTPTIWLAGTVVALLGGSAAVFVALAGSASGSAQPYPAGKLALITAQQNALAKEQAAHRTKPSYAAGLNAAKSADGEAVPARTAGITTIHEGPFSPSSFAVQNMYQGPIQGTWMLAYAGATSNPVTGSNATGALALYAEPEVGGPMTALGTFEAPAGTGSLIVTAASGNVLTLSSSQGQQLTFNLLTDNYGT